MTTTCEHAVFTWYDQILAIRESASPKIARETAHPGHWECLLCGTMIAQPMGLGLCRSCSKAYDDHEHYFPKVDGVPDSARPRDVPKCRRG